MNTKFNRILQLTVVASVFGIICATSLGCDDEPIFEEVTYEKINSWTSQGSGVVIIDVREPADFVAGHIQNAINIPLSKIMDSAGQIINSGGVLTTAVPDKNTPIVTYCFGWGNEKMFADIAAELNYKEVYYYTGGTEDWDTRANYLVIEYEGFKAWHAAYSPFENGQNYLIDDLPPEWYDGTDPDHPGGHIPCAINIPIGNWADSAGNIINDAVAFTSVATNKNAKVVIYCGNWECGKSLVGAQVAASLGYTSVYRYQGGQAEWMAKGEPTVEGQEPCAPGTDTETRAD